MSPHGRDEVRRNIGAGPRGARPAHHDRRWRRLGQAPGRWSWSRRSAASPTCSVARDARDRRRRRAASADQHPHASRGHAADAGHWRPPLCSSRPPSSARSMTSRPSTARSRHWGEASPRSLDILAATGELLSSRIVAAAFEAAGVRSQWFDARTLVRHRRAVHGGGAPQRSDRRALPGGAVPALGEGRLPVIGGFIGATSDGATTTLGRGGSDYSAAIVGAAIAADEIQIGPMSTACSRPIPASSLTRAWCRSCRLTRPAS